LSKEEINALCGIFDLNLHYIEKPNIMLALEQLETCKFIEGLRLGFSQIN